MTEFIAKITTHPSERGYKVSIFETRPIQGWQKLVFSTSAASALSLRKARRRANDLLANFREANAPETIVEVIR